MQNNKETMCEKIDGFVACTMKVTPELADYTKKKFGKVLCRNHMYQLEEQEKYQQSL